MGTSMTHDELRDYIDKFDAAGMINEPAVKALRVVVELHKPNGRKCEKCGENVCWGCGEWGCGDDCHCSCHGVYPCATIKAIEQELR